MNLINLHRFRYVLYMCSIHASSILYIRSAQSPFLSASKIALIDSADLNYRCRQSDNCYSNRVVSLTPSSLRFLQSMGACNHIPNHRIKPYSQMQVWDAVGKGWIHFDSLEVNNQALAYIVETPLLASSILSAISENNAKRGLHLFSKVSVEAIQYPNGLDSHPFVHLSNGHKLQAQLIIACDGANSRVRDLAKIDIMKCDYHHSGLVATIQTNEEENDVAWQRFLPTGPVALLPLTNIMSSLVWTLPTPLAHKIKALPKNTFVALLNAALTLPHNEMTVFNKHLTRLTGQMDPITGDLCQDIQWRLDSYSEKFTNDSHATIVPPYIVDVVDNSRACFPLTLRHAEQYVKGRVVLVSDAAHTIHPLAGQGLNLGLTNVEKLQQVINEAIVQGQDIGHPHILQRYTAARYGANYVMLTACDKLHHLFGTDNKVVSVVRSLGLSAVDMMAPLKRQIMKYAMGQNTTHS